MYGVSVKGSVGANPHWIKRKDKPPKISSSYPNKNLQTSNNGGRRRYFITSKQSSWFWKIASRVIIPSLNFVFIQAFQWFHISIFWFFIYIYSSEFIWRRWCYVIDRCNHYRRRCKIRAPCCNQIFFCRHCHNESTVVNLFSTFVYHEFWIILQLIGGNCWLIDVFCNFELYIQSGLTNPKERHEIVRHDVKQVLIFLLYEILCLFASNFVFWIDMMR